MNAYEEIEKSLTPFEVTVTFLEGGKGVTNITANLANGKTVEGTYNIAEDTWSVKEAVETTTEEYKAQKEENGN